MQIPRRPVRLYGLLAVGRELGLPVARALLLLGEGVSLMQVVVNVCFFFIKNSSVAFHNQSYRKNK